MSKTKRLQVLIDDAGFRRLQLESKRTGASIGALVREAINERFGSQWPAADEAAARLLAAEPMEVGDWAGIERELEGRHRAGA